MKILIFSFLLFSLTAPAEIEKVARVERSANKPCKGELCFYWWPKLSSMKGWHQDKQANYEIGANVLVPDGSTFSNSESIIYARAIYKPRRSELKSLDALIEEDKKDFLTKNKSIKINAASSITTSTNQKLKVFNFFPEKDGNWEQVAYGEETDFYILFTLSSRKKSGFDKVLADFNKLVSSYK